MTGVGWIQKAEIGFWGSSGHVWLSVVLVYPNLGTFLDPPSLWYSPPPGWCISTPLE